MLLLLFLYDVSLSGLVDNVTSQVFCCSYVVINCAVVVSGKVYDQIEVVRV